MTDKSENETVARVLRLTGGKYRFLKDVPRDGWTDEHEAELERQIAEDPDDDLLDDDDVVETRPFREVFPEGVEIVRRGRPPSENPKRAIKLRLDADVIDRFKSGGRGWQTRMNEALRKAAGLR